MWSCRSMTSGYLRSQRWLDCLSTLSHECVLWKCNVPSFLLMFVQQYPGRQLEHLLLRIQPTVPSAFSTVVSPNKTTCEAGCRELQCALAKPTLRNALPTLDFQAMNTHWPFGSNQWKCVLAKKRKKWPWSYREPFSELYTSSCAVGKLNSHTRTKLITSHQLIFGMAISLTAR